MADLDQSLPAQFGRFGRCGCHRGCDSLVVRDSYSAEISANQRGHATSHGENVMIFQPKFAADDQYSYYKVMSQQALTVSSAVVAPTVPQGSA